MYSQSCDDETSLQRRLARDVGEAIRQARTRRGISQARLAVQTSMDRSYMGRIERGMVNITTEKLYRIAGALSCCIDDLLP